jgi:hypothetical protein
VTQKFIDNFRKGKGKENTPAAAAAAVVDTHVAAILPDIDDPNDSSGTSDGDLSGCNMSFPYKIPHFFWKFLMDGPAVDFPIPVRGLIDDGSHLVLITPELVDRLELRRRLLHIPETVDVALSDSSTSKRTLTEYIHLRCISTDSRWTSNTVRALIAPGLCAPVILGLPWLARNHVVIDHHKCTVVDKQVNYNLLDPAPLPLPKPPLIKLCERMKTTKADHITMAKELASVCASRRERLERDSLFEPVKEVDVIALRSEP